MTPRRLGALTLGLASLWAVLAAYAIHPAMPFNTIHLPMEQHLRVSLWFPEGWGFFTRDPRAERLTLYRLDGGRWMRAGRGPNSEPVNVFGINRAARAQAVEAGLLINEGTASPLAWIPCTALPSDCLLEARPVAAQNRSRAPSLCGALGLVTQEPVPWAWLGNRRPVTMPSSIARLEVSC
jgi:antimicrobial peptide system SdpA family protein